METESPWPRWNVLFLMLGVGFLLFTIFTGTGMCAPVGGYDGPSGIHYYIIEISELGFAYGNGCRMTYQTLGGVLSLLCIGIGVWQTRR
jgi:hypothetical protein